MSDPAPLRVTLGPSRLIAGGLAALHAATLAPLWWAGLPIWASVGLTFTIALHGGWAVRRFGLLRSPRSIVGIALDTGSGCTLRERDGGELKGTVDPSTLVLGFLVVLAVAVPPAQGRRRVVVAPDMLAAAAFRQLRMVLKWGDAQPSPRSHA